MRLIPAACLGLLVLPLAACNFNATPATNANAAADAKAPPAAAPSEQDMLARGEYIARIGGCNDCHTPGFDQSQGTLPTKDWLVGSPMGFNGPWGTTYAANLRLKVAEMDEAAWMDYTANLHTRPIMPDFNVRAMHEDDRRALYRFIRSLGPAGSKAPDYLPPGQMPAPPYFQVVLPPPAPGAKAG